ncbi:PhnE/PtxC family ABC transporter permease [Clostridium lacusfryxellense]|uniref:PhnE/PtxC family ABC transporter permease n=1 Tax=Clostridium lacusfryxellense TaxID=205328 RepID=UPI001C0D0D90|nr:ABC transporter permease subunit [Clostridium lacusfryxellense]MBU3112524.1 ABC transporter permease subunit [Clostridium lacusfryxellense]
MDIDIFQKKKKKLVIFWIGIILISVGAMTITQYDPVLGITSIPKAIIWACSNFYPNVESLSRLPKILIKLKETVFLSIAATTTASALALLFSLLGSKTTNDSTIISTITRLIASVFRNVPDTVWAMVLLFSFGQNAMTGYFALFFTTFGILTRAFIESIDEASRDSVEALKSTGASYFQIVSQAVIPSCIPQLISWVLFMLETNIRSSTLIGLLTGTGIGYTFSMYYKSMQYNAASLVVISIVLSVFIIEFISNYVRRVIL